MSASNSVATVRAQYEDLPYPPVDPQDELRDLKSTFADYPARVNHYGWGGKRDFSKGFRILVAGGGTGNSAIYMAEHYCPMGAEIVYIDLSSASIKIAKKRAELRKIDTIRFLQGSLLDLPTLKLGKFDYIECSGVLHHLPNPALGLHALTEMLAADGVLNLMVYGKIGRTAIYHMQRALAVALEGVEDRGEKVRVARQIVNHLPSSAWFQHNRQLFQGEVNSDSGLFDLLLHSQDRAYSLPELHEWLAESGLQALTFLDNYTNGRVIHDPLTYVPRFDKTILETLSLAKQEEIAEILAGTMMMHTCYVASSAKSLPNVADEEFVPTWGFMAHRLPKGELGRMVAHAAGPEVTFQVQSSPYKIILTKQPSTVSLLHAIDEVQTISQLIESVAAKDYHSEEEVRNDFRLLYEEMNKHDLLLLRHSSVQPYPEIHALQAKMVARRKSGQMLSQTLKKKN